MIYQKIVLIKLSKIASILQIQITTNGQLIVYNFNSFKLKVQHRKLFLKSLIHFLRNKLLYKKLTLNFTINGYVLISVTEFSFNFKIDPK